MHAYKLICGLVCWLIALPAWSSYAIYIGKNLTADGSVMIGGSGDEVSSHWLEVVPLPPTPRKRRSPWGHRRGLYAG
ncbi:MAG: hypothetical protein CM15mP103_08420 [Gammaproteobacteria bacterium]|nr:MAG: hypothetical protein CM15mP103_08420 [Gammaproteobacteria bacterium]